MNTCNWAEVCDVSCDQFFFRRTIFKTIKNMKNSDFRQKQHFLLQKKILKFDKSKPFMDEFVKLSRKLKYNKIIYKLKIKFAERNQN